MGRCRLQPMISCCRALFTITTQPLKRTGPEWEERGLLIASASYVRAMESGRWSLTMSPHPRSLPVVIPAPRYKNGLVCAGHEHHAVFFRTWEDLANTSKRHSFDLLRKLSGGNEEFVLLAAVQYVRVCRAVCGRDPVPVDSG